MSLKHTLSAFGAVILGAALIYSGVATRESLVTEQARSPSSHQKSGDMTDSDKAAMQSLKASLEDKLPGIEIADIAESPLEGFYQVFFSGQLLYVSADGMFVFTGNLLELADEAPINHSMEAIAEMEARQAPARAKVIAAIDESDMVVFKAPEEKHVITVFTDVDCAYCRKLHREVPTLNKNGVTVRYLAYPRAGIGSAAYKKLVSVWCSEDRTAAMDDAKLKRKFGQKSCKNPIAAQYELTREFNLSGTPALILEDGELIGGYVPSADLIGHLEDKASGNSSSVSQVSSGQ